MGRNTHKMKMKKGTWSAEEDAVLMRFVQWHGNGGNWMTLPTKAGLNWSGKSYLMRWVNYLRPDVNLGGYTEEEDQIICSHYTKIGSKWSSITSQLPGGTGNHVKNH